MILERTAVVTGASSGVGFEVALGLARDGFRVIALGRTASRIEASRSALAEAVPEATVDWLQANLAVIGEVTFVGACARAVMGNSSAARVPTSLVVMFR